MEKNHHDENEEAKSQHRFLFAIAIPLIVVQNGVKYEMHSVDYAEERNFILRALDESKKKIYFCTEIATPTKLMKQLSIGATILHLSGHGNQEWIAFEGEDGCVQYLVNERLRNLFSAGGIKTKVVFVSSCYSEMAGRKLVEAGVPHVIAVKIDQRLPEKTSWTFAEIFYFNIFHGKTVRQAYDIAVHTVAAEIGPTYASNIFLLLPEDSSHDEVVFKDIPSGHYIDDTIVLGNNYCDKPVHRFIGRKVPMQAIYSYFAMNKSRTVTIMGERGIGKTALANEICHYMNERRLFDVIYFIPLSIEYCSNILANHLNNTGSNSSTGNSTKSPNSDRSNQFIDKNILAIILAVSISKNENLDIDINRINNIGDLLSFLKKTVNNQSSRILFVLDGFDSLFLTYPSTQSSHEDDDSDDSNSDDSNDKIIGFPESVRMSEKIYKTVLPSSTSTECKDSEDTNHDKMLMSAILDTLNTILNQTKNVSFLTTSTFSLSNSDRTIDSGAEKVVFLNSLDNLQAAQLLVTRSSRELSAEETGGASNQEELSRHPVFYHLQGNPRAIVKFASTLNNKITLGSPETIIQAKKIRNEVNKRMDPPPRSTIFSKILRGGNEDISVCEATWSSPISNNSPASSTSSGKVFSWEEGRTPSRVTIKSPLPPIPPFLRATSSASASTGDATATALSPPVVPAMSSLAINTIDRSASSNSNTSSSSSKSNSNSSSNSNNSNSSSNQNITCLRSVNMLTTLPIAEAVPIIPVSKSSSKPLEVAVRCHSSTPKNSILPPPPSPPIATAILINQLPDINDTKAVWRMMLLSQPNVVEDSNSNSRRNNSGSNNNSMISWNHLVTYLALQLQSRVEDEDISLEKRSLTSNDKQYLNIILMEIRQKNKSDIPPSSDNNSHCWITESLFNSFYSWWILTIATLSSRAVRSEFFTKDSVLLIHGFVGRKSVEHMLLGSGIVQSGVFMIRCSESSPGSLAISFVDLKKNSTGFTVVHSLIKVSQDGTNIYYDSNKEKSYHSLSALILQCNKFIFLYPNIHKDAVFALNRYEPI